MEVMGLEKEFFRGCKVDRKVKLVRRVDARAIKAKVLKKVVGAG
jgi:hypothetical protein